MPLSTLSSAKTTLHDVGVTQAPRALDARRELLFNEGRLPNNTRRMLRNVA